MALTDPWSGAYDTDCDYYETPSGNIWCPTMSPRNQAPGQNQAPQGWPDRSLELGRRQPNDRYVRPQQHRTRPS